MLILMNGLFSATTHLGSPHLENSTIAGVVRYDETVLLIKHSVMYISFIDCHNKGHTATMG